MLLCIKEKLHFQSPSKPFRVPSKQCDICYETPVVGVAEDNKSKVKVKYIPPPEPLVNVLGSG